MATGSRTIWKGAITFGLVHIPVGLHTASVQDRLTGRPGASAGPDKRSATLRTVRCHAQRLDPATRPLSLKTWMRS